MKIKKALITAAGFGTRFLPVTKTIQKEMLPILNKPLIDYVVDDCIRAGIEEIVFVVKPGDSQVRQYYSESVPLRYYLKKMGKLEKYDAVKELHSKAKFTFVEQLDSDPYGTAVPVMKAREQLELEDAFLVFMGDDFIFNGPDYSLAREMISLYEASKAGAVATFIERPKETISKYGVAEYIEENGFKYLQNIIEKPSAETAPSNLANISKYIFTPLIFDIIAAQKPDAASGELYITDSLLEFSRRSKVAIHIPQGEYLDGGYILGWLRANLVLGLADASLHADLLEMIRSFAH